MTPEQEIADLKQRLAASEARGENYQRGLEHWKNRKINLKKYGKWFGEELSIEEAEMRLNSYFQNMMYANERISTLEARVMELEQSIQEGLCKALETDDCCCNSCLLHAAVEKTVTLEQQVAALRKDLEYKQAYVERLERSAREVVSTHEQNCNDPECSAIDHLKKPWQTTIRQLTQALEGIKNSLKNGKIGAVAECILQAEQAINAALPQKGE